MKIQEAKKIAEKYISKNIPPPEGDEYKIIEEAIFEMTDGWYFPYQSKNFIETGNMNFSLVGNWPVFVSRSGVCTGPRRPD
ncbi:hypothetical protein EII20_00940 [Comamonadaceae bacterium OH2545_COT-014]|nr:hypothetical protein EII20_00940 [Comamonadaceae bacterium OH2545_COT-014]